MTPTDATKGTKRARLAWLSQIIVADPAALTTEGAHELDDGLEELLNALETIADFPEPLNNKGSAQAQCAWLKRQAREALDG